MTTPDKPQINQMDQIIQDELRNYPSERQREAYPYVTYGQDLLSDQPTSQTETSDQEWTQEELEDREMWSEAHNNAPLEIQPSLTPDQQQWLLDNPWDPLTLTDVQGGTWEFYVDLQMGIKVLEVNYSQPNNPTT